MSMHMQEPSCKNDVAHVRHPPYFPLNLSGPRCAATLSPGAFYRRLPFCTSHIRAIKSSATESHKLGRGVVSLPPPDFGGDANHSDVYESMLCVEPTATLVEADQRLVWLGKVILSNCLRPVPLQSLPVQVP